MKRLPKYTPAEVRNDPYGFTYKEMSEVIGENEAKAFAIWLMFRLTACSSRIYAFVSLRSTTRIYPSKLLNRKESINMFSENLKAMRKAKGYTQEELAIKLNVTRQTISKWEKGLSVPDVDFLFKIADVLETNVGTLLGGAIMDEVNKDTVAEQLAKISEQLAIKNRRSKRIWKIVGIVLLTILALNLLLAIFGMSAYTSFSTDGKTTVIEMNEDSVSYEE